MIKLKSCTPNSWILSQNDENVGIVSKKIDNTFSLIYKNQKSYFSSKEELVDFFKQDIFVNQVKLKPLEKDKVSYVKGYPVSVVDVFEPKIKSILPVFTKTEKSKVVFAAGFYCVRYDKGWLQSFCPKLSTLSRYPHTGPFKTKADLKHELTRLQHENV